MKWKRSRKVGQHGSKKKESLGYSSSEENPERSTPAEPTFKNYNSDKTMSNLKDANNYQYHKNTDQSNTYPATHFFPTFAPEKFTNEETHQSNQSNQSTENLTDIQHSTNNSTKS